MSARAIQHVTALLLLVFAVVPENATAQVPDRNMSAADVAKSLRTKGHPGAARAILTQTYGQRSQGELDEIANTLVAIAIHYPGDDARGASIRGEAVRALAGAGAGRNGRAGDDLGVAYAGAGARLLRIAQEAEDVGMRGAALASFKYQPDREASVQSLRTVAESQNSSAWLAVHLLGNETGPEGLAVARQLHEAGSVTEPRARSALSGIAHHYGWVRKSR